MGSGTSVGVVSHDRGESGLECQHPPHPHKDNSFPSLCTYIQHSINDYSFPPRRDIKTEDVAIIKGIIGRG